MNSLVKQIFRALTPRIEGAFIVMASLGVYLGHEKASGIGALVFLALSFAADVWFGVRAARLDRRLHELRAESDRRTDELLRLSKEMRAAGIFAAATDRNA